MGDEEMNENLENQLVRSIFQFKRLATTGFGMDLVNKNNQLNMTELMLMNELADNITNSGNNVGLADVTEYLSVSKPAVSQILNSLEKKGFIIREIDKNNRRNLIVTLTDDGRMVLENEITDFSDNLKHIISHLGEDDVRSMITIVNRMIKITNQLNHEKSQDK